MSEEPELILNPDHARAALEIDLDSPATKRDVATFVEAYVQDYIKGYMENTVKPVMGQILAQQNALFKQVKAANTNSEWLLHQFDAVARLTNTLLDFLTFKGMRLGKNGRMYISNAEFDAFVQKKNEVSHVDSVVEKLDPEKPAEAHPASPETQA